jgi:hypothetical protein
MVVVFVSTFHCSGTGPYLLGRRWHFAVDLKIVIDACTFEKNGCKDFYYENDEAKAHFQEEELEQESWL